MKLLITGGAGFIGSNFVRYWLRKYKNDSITVLDKLTYAGHLSSLKDVSRYGRFRFIKGDICNRTLVDNLTKSQDLIVHLAAESHVDRSITDPSVFVKTNVLGTQILLDAAVKNHVSRFHHVSTDEVFGDLPLDSEEKFTELTPYAPHSPYSASKAASDHLVNAYFHTYGLNTTISNCSNNYGPFQDPEKFIPRMITSLLSGRTVKIYGDGKYIRDWLFVGDHCRAIDLIIHKGRVGETYCIGGQKRLFTNLEIAQKIVAIIKVGKNPIEFVTDRPGHDRKYAVDWSKIHTRLGWQPTYTLDLGLQDTAAWYTKNGWWWHPLKSRAESIY